MKLWHVYYGDWDGLLITEDIDIGEARIKANTLLYPTNGGLITSIVQMVSSVGDNFYELEINAKVPSFDIRIGGTTL